MCGRKVYHTYWLVRGSRTRWWRETKRRRGTCSTGGYGGNPLSYVAKFCIYWHPDSCHSVVLDRRRPPGLESTKKYRVQGRQSGTLGCFVEHADVSSMSRKYLSVYKNRSRVSERSSCMLLGVQWLSRRHATRETHTYHCVTDTHQHIDRCLTQCLVKKIRDTSGVCLSRVC